MDIKILTAIFIITVIDLLAIIKIIMLIKIDSTIIYFPIMFHLYYYLAMKQPFMIFLVGFDFIEFEFKDYY